MKPNDTELLTTAALIRALLRLELLDEHHREEAHSAPRAGGFTPEAVRPFVRETRSLLDPQSVSHLHGLTL